MIGRTGSISEFWSLAREPLARAAIIVAGSLVAARLIERLCLRLLGKVADGAAIDLDERAVESLRRAIFLAVLSCGLGWALEVLQLPTRIDDLLDALLWTLVILAGALAGGRLGAVLLRSASRRELEGSVLQPRTLGLFEVLLRTLLVAAAAYFLFLAWDINLDAWLVSAGAVGLTIGFAAKDVLGDLFSGVLISTYHPFEVGDWVVLDHTKLRLRGKVTQIGLRSTRILTADGAEIPVPNGVIGNRTLINETRGRHRRQRVRIPFVVGYGTEVARVRALILAASDGAADVLEQPRDAAPKVMLRRLGSRGLEFELWVWIDDPQVRETVIDEVTARIYERLSAAGIGFPSPSYSLRVSRPATVRRSS